MKAYPSIDHYHGYNNDMYIFDKIDGSNLRFEWNKKKGWYKYGTRNRLFDHTDPEFGPAISMFDKTLREPLSQIAKDNKWESVVVFCEYWGN